MKFEKNPGHSSPTGLTDEQIIAANRWQEREARRKESFVSVPVPPYQRQRVGRLLRELADSINGGPPDPWRVPRASGARGKDARQVPAYREAAEQHLSDLMDRYADEPLTSVSPELQSLLAPKDEDIGQD